MDAKSRNLIREAIPENLAEFAEEHGLTVTVKGGSYHGGQVTMKVEFAVKTADGNAMTAEAEAFKWAAGRYDLRVDDLWREMALGGYRYKLVGFKSRARRSPFLGRSLHDGKLYRFDISEVKRGLEMA